MKTLDQNLSDITAEWTKLFASLIPDICDDYRVSDDCDDETPGMQVTIGYTQETENSDQSWPYQTGDNSYSGGAYSHRNWAVISLYRDSDPTELAKEAADQIADLVSQ